MAWARSRPAPRAGAAATARARVRRLRRARGPCAFWSDGTGTFWRRDAPARPGGCFSSPPPSLQRRWQGPRSRHSGGRRAAAAKEAPEHKRVQPQRRPARMRRAFFTNAVRSDEFCASTFNAQPWGSVLAAISVKYEILGPPQKGGFAILGPKVAKSAATAQHLSFARRSRRSCAAKKIAHCSGWPAGVVQIFGTRRATRKSGPSAPHGTSARLRSRPPLKV